jgi:hypothetical protein
MNWAEFGIAVGQEDRQRVGLLALGLRQCQPNAAVGLLQMFVASGRQFRAAQRRRSRPGGRPGRAGPGSRSLSSRLLAALAPV